MDEELSLEDYKMCILFLIICEAFYNKLMLINNGIKRQNMGADDVLLLIFLDHYLKRYE